MAAGDVDAVKRCMPVFQVLGENIFNLGASGRGHAVKAFANYVSAALLTATMEGMLACKRFGVDPTLVLGVFNASPAYNSMTRKTIPEEVFTRKFATGFQIGYMVKDLRAAMEIAAEIGIPTPMGSLCLELWAEAAKELGPHAEYAAYARYMEMQAGETIAPADKPAPVVSR